MSTGDGVIGYVAVDLYLGRCGRVGNGAIDLLEIGMICGCISLLGTLW